MGNKQAGLVITYGNVIVPKLMQDRLSLFFAFVFVSFFFFCYFIILHYICGERNMIRQGIYGI